MFKVCQKLSKFKLNKFKYSRVFDDIYKRSIHEKEEFWAEQAEGISWIKPFEKVFGNFKFYSF